MYQLYILRFRKHLKETCSNCCFMSYLLLREWVNARKPLYPALSLSILTRERTTKVSLDSILFYSIVFYSIHSTCFLQPIFPQLTSFFSAIDKPIADACKPQEGSHMSNQQVWIKGAGFSERGKLLTIDTFIRLSAPFPSIIFRKRTILSSSGSFWRSRGQSTGKS